MTSAREDREELRRMLGHIILHHPDIPELPPKEGS